MSPPTDDPTPSTARHGAAPPALVVGEALIDVVVRPDGRQNSHPGGSPANVALGLARLDRPVELVSWLGQDDHGEQIHQYLSSSGVHITPESRQATRTSVATAYLDAEGAATYNFDLEWRLPDTGRRADRPFVVHTGSLAAVLDPGGSAVRAYMAAARSSATVTYDPNARPSAMPPASATLPLVEQAVAVADVVKVSDEDLAWLSPGEDPDDVIRRWAACGPAVVVLTQGGRGSRAMTCSGLHVEVPAHDVTVADTVGAGDSFMAGLIDGLWTADLLGASRREELRSISVGSLTSILARSARIAAITVCRTGANLPTTADLLE